MILQVLDGHSKIIQISVYETLFAQSFNEPQAQTAHAKGFHSKRVNPTLICICAVFGEDFDLHN